MDSSRRALGPLQCELLEASVVVDSEREIAANKLCALVGRCEVRDLVDLEALLEHGIGLERALEDVAKKDGGVNAATLSVSNNRSIVVAPAQGCSWRSP